MLRGVSEAVPSGRAGGWIGGSTGGLAGAPRTLPGITGKPDQRATESPGPPRTPPFHPKTR